MKHRHKWVYLVEKVEPDKHLEPVAICTSFELAHKLLKANKYLISRLEINYNYENGIGSCQHWHY